VARGFVEAVVRPIRELAEITLDAEAILGGLLGPGSIVSRVINAYRRHLYGEATLQDLPDRPEFVINAANVQSGALWRFSKAAMRDYRVGEIKNPRLLLATAVASSTAFPPFLSPVVIDLDPADFTPASGMDLQREPFTSKVYLSDGGVYDNLGLETVWKRYDTVLVSDGGGKMEAEGEPNVDWPRHTYRVLTLIDNQVRALRKRQVIEAFIQRSRMLAEGVDPSSPGFRSATRKGAYWGIRSDIGDYRLENALPAPFERTQELANTPTRMQTMPAELQERLINWGYAICDAAMRKHVAPEMAAPAGLPYPASGI
jgi:NTE family protein